MQVEESARLREVGEGVLQAEELAYAKKRRGRKHCECGEIKGLQCCWIFKHKVKKKKKVVLEELKTYIECYRLG